MEAYDFATATQQLYSWWQYELCDVFIELMKPVMAKDDAQPGEGITSCTVLEQYRWWPGAVFSCRYLSENMLCKTSFA